MKKLLSTTGIGLGIGLIMAASGCKSSQNENVLVIDPENAENVYLEDVATDIRVVPLKADEPLDKGIQLECHGNEALILSSDMKKVYYYVDGVLTAKLDAAGRGPCEYNFAYDMHYSPKYKELYIRDVGSGNTPIHRYSVPDMKHIGTFSFNMGFASMTEFDDSRLFVTGTYDTDDGKTSFFFGLADRKGGAVERIDSTQSPVLGSYADKNRGFRSDNRIMSYCGPVNRICSVDENGGISDLLSYTLLGHEIDAEKIEWDYNNMETYLQALLYVLQSDRMLGGQFAQTKDGALTFWYGDAQTVALDAGPTYYVSVKDGKIEKHYTGFEVPGLNIPILPKCTDSKGGYVMILQNDPETIRDDSVEASPLAKEILSALAHQPDDNPILVYFTL